jgi:hydrogenase maturation protease
MATLWQVAGVGSPHGDDRVGWAVIERLAARGAPAELTMLDQPLDLLDLMSLCTDCERLVVVDACATGAAPGTITRLVWPDRRILYQHKHLTHSLALSDALQIADQLDRLPPLVVLYGVEIADCQRETGLSPAVQRALPELERLLLVQVTSGSVASHVASSPSPHQAAHAGPSAVRRLPGRSHERRVYTSSPARRQFPPRVE